MNPDISIIIPIYNVELYLSRCIDSVLNQTFQNYEIILIDDGSIDNSGNICDIYANNYKRISVIHQKNLGVSTARNVGIMHAKGDFITFVDADDWLDKDYLAILFQLAVSNNADISCCTLSYEGDTGRSEEFATQSSDSNKQMQISIEMREFNFGKWYSFEGAACKLIRKTLLYDNNILYDTTLTNGEDALFYVEVMLRSKCCVAISRPMYHYFMRSNSASNNVGIKQLFSDLVAWDMICKKINMNYCCYNDAAKRLLFKLFNIINFSKKNGITLNSGQIKYCQGLFHYYRKYRSSHGRGFKFEISYFC